MAENNNNNGLVDEMVKGLFAAVGTLVVAGIGSKISESNQKRKEKKLRNKK